MTTLLVGYVISNLVGIAMIAIARLAPRVARLVIAGGFAIAAVVNGVLALRAPESYLSFASHALPPYPWLIEHAARWMQLLVLAIAVVQLSGAVLLAFGGRRAARSGGLALIAFLIAIAPFGIGSAFPASLLMATAVWLILPSSS